MQKIRRAVNPVERNEPNEILIQGVTQKGTHEAMPQRSRLMLRQTMTFFMSLCQLSGWERLFKYCRSPYKCERS